MSVDKENVIYFGNEGLQKIWDDIKEYAGSETFCHPSRDTFYRRIPQTNLMLAHGIVGWFVAEYQEVVQSPHYHSEKLMHQIQKHETLCPGCWNPMLMRTL